MVISIEYSVGFFLLMLGTSKLNKRSATAYKPQNGQTFHVQNITNRGIFVWKIVHLSLGLL